MLHLHRLFSLLVTVSCPLLGVAQTSAPKENHCTLFVGLGALIGSYQLPSGLSANVVSPVPMVGVQVQPRLAIQASAAYYQESQSAIGGAPLVTQGQVKYLRVEGNDRRRTVPVLVLGRYTLTRRAEKHFQADVLTGITLLHSSLNQQRTIFDTTGVATSTNNYVTTTTSTYFALGASARYRMKPHLDLMTDWVFNKLLNGQSGVPSRLSATLSVGLRYRFEL